MVHQHAAEQFALFVVFRIELAAEEVGEIDQTIVAEQDGAFAVVELPSHTMTGTDAFRDGFERLVLCEHDGRTAVQSAARAMAVRIADHGNHLPALHVFLHPPVHVDHVVFAALHVRAQADEFDRIELAFFHDIFAHRLRQILAHDGMPERMRENRHTAIFVDLVEDPVRTRHEPTHLLRLLRIQFLGIRVQLGVEFVKMVVHVFRDALLAAEMDKMDGRLETVAAHKRIDLLRKQMDFLARKYLEIKIKRFQIRHREHCGITLHVVRNGEIVQARIAGVRRHVARILVAVAAFRIACMAMHVATERTQAEQILFQRVHRKMENLTLRTTIRRLDHKTERVFAFMRQCHIHRPAIHRFVICLDRQRFEFAPLGRTSVEHRPIVACIFHPDAAILLHRRKTALFVTRLDRHAFALTDRKDSRIDVKIIV